MKTAVSMRLDGDLLKKAKKAAASERRSLTNFVEVALAQRLNQRRGDADRVTVIVPEGEHRLRGGRLVPAEWETPEETARAQALWDRVFDAVEREGDQIEKAQRNRKRRA